MFQSILNRYWSPMVALLLAGFFSALYFGLTGMVWAVTGEFTRLGAHVLHFFHISTEGWAYFDLVKVQGSSFERPDGWIVWGMLAGSLLMVLLNQSFKLRMPMHNRRLWQALLGGVIAGFGARMAMGCNLAAFFTGVPQFSLHSWIFIVTTVIGSFLGAKIIRKPWWKGKVQARKPSAQTVAKSRLGWQRPVAVVLFLAALGLIAYYLVTGQTKLALGVTFGLIFGILLERGQICFTSALRDLWLFNSSGMSKAIVAGMALSSVMTLIFITQTGATPITQISALSTVVGGVLFGLGIVLASACETGMMYRMMEGQVVYLVAFIGNIIGATVLAYGWDHWHLAALLAQGERINLLNLTTPILALAATLIFLAVLYFLPRLKEAKYS
ncbi:MAG: selenium metabolism membrane protein YedE/FdhT [Venatoribacter sp.]